VEIMTSDGGIRTGDRGKLDADGFLIPVLEKHVRAVNPAIDLSDILNNTEVKNLITLEIANHLKKKYGGYEIPKKIVFVNEDFTVDNGMLTQTMKLKRRFVVQRHNELIAGLYSGEESA